MSVHYRFGHRSILKASLALIALLNVGAMEPAKAEDVKSDAVAHELPMDEDWHAISSDALIKELSRMALELETQRKINATLTQRIDGLTKRLDALEGGSEEVHVVLDVEDGAAKTVSAPAVDLTKVTEKKEPESYTGWAREKGSAIWQSVTNW